MWIPRVVALLALAAQIDAQNSACIQFGRFSVAGSAPGNLLPAGTLHEISGIEHSRSNPDVLWVHDDAGNGNQLVALSTTGQLVQQYRIDNVANFDWEDIAIGPGQDVGRDYIYLGDIGNNALTQNVFSLVRLAEPSTPAQPAPTIAIANTEVFAFRYPSTPHNAETLMIDPVDGTPYVLTKEKRSTGQAYLYSYPLPLDANQIKTLKLLRTIPHADPRFSAGDVSSDGKWVIVRNESTVFTYLRGAPTTPFGDAFGNLVCAFDGSGQGNAEAITISPDGTRLYATSEAVQSPIFESIGTLPRGTVAMPAWWTFGTGAPSTQWGVPGLSLDTFPALGRPVSITVWSARPLATAAIGFGVQAIPDGILRLAGGWAHVSPAILLFSQTSVAGTLEIPLGLPTGTSLLGLTLHAQTGIDDGAARHGLALSRGLSLQFGR